MFGPTEARVSIMPLEQKHVLVTCFWISNTVHQGNMLLEKKHVLVTCFCTVERKKNYIIFRGFFTLQKHGTKTCFCSRSTLLTHATHKLNK